MMNFKRHKSTFIGMLAMVAIAFIVAFGSAYMEKEGKSEYESKIGKTVYIGNDTLLVVNFNRIEESFTLSNGVTVHKNFVK